MKTLESATLIPGIKDKFLMAFERKHKGGRKKEFETQTRSSAHMRWLSRGFTKEESDPIGKD